MLKVQCCFILEEVEMKGQKIQRIGIPKIFDFIKKNSAINLSKTRFCTRKCNVKYNNEFLFLNDQNITDHIILKIFTSTIYTYK